MYIINRLQRALASKDALVKDLKAKLEDITNPSPEKGYSYHDIYIYIYILVLSSFIMYTYFYMYYFFSLYINHKCKHGYYIYTYF